MDKLTFCNNYLYSCGQVIFMFVDKLSLLWCLFCFRRYVCWLCLYVEMKAMRDRVDLSMRTDSKETMINKPPSHLFTVVALPLHASEECSQTSNGRQMLIGNRLYSTLPITVVISNGLKQPVIDRAFISNGLYELVTDRFNLCNGLYLTHVTMNSCNERLRRPLPEVHIRNRCCGCQPRGRPAALICNRRQMWVHVMGVKSWLQMLYDLF
jgi:hypothetical protein